MGLSVPIKLTYSWEEVRSISPRKKFVAWHTLTTSSSVCLPGCFFLPNAVPVYCLFGACVHAKQSLILFNTFLFPNYFGNCISVQSLHESIVHKATQHQQRTKIRASLERLFTTNRHAPLVFFSPAKLAAAHTAAETPFPDGFSKWLQPALLSQQSSSSHRLAETLHMSSTDQTEKF